MEDRLGVVAGIVACLLIGLGTWWVAANTVTCSEVCVFADKRFEPAHTRHWTTYHCLSWGKSGNCTVNMPVHHSEFVPDRWFIDWRDAYGSKDFPEQISQAVYQNPPAATQHRHSRWKQCPPAQRGVW